MELTELQELYGKLKEDYDNMASERDMLKSENSKLTEDNNKLRDYNNKLFMKVYREPEVSEPKQKSVLSDADIAERFRKGRK